MTPDLEMARRFLLVLDPLGIFTFQTFSDKKSNQAKCDPLARVLHGSFGEHTAALMSLQQRGAGIFVMVNRGNGIVPGGRKTCRVKQSVVAIRALFTDLDGAPIAPVLAALRPDIVVESSPDRWHVYWLTNDCELADFQRRQTQIAAKFNGDASVNDLPRVMRLPGFLHQKKAEPFMTRMTFPE